MAPFDRSSPLCESVQQLAKGVPHTGPHRSPRYLNDQIFQFGIHHGVERNHRAPFPSSLFSFHLSSSSSSSFSFSSFRLLLPRPVFPFVDSSDTFPLSPLTRLDSFSFLALPTFRSFPSFLLSFFPSPLRLFAQRRDSSLHPLLPVVSRRSWSSSKGFCASSSSARTVATRTSRRTPTNEGERHRRRRRRHRRHRRRRRRRCLRRRRRDVSGLFCPGESVVRTYVGVSTLCSRGCNVGNRERATVSAWPGSNPSEFMRRATNAKDTFPPQNLRAW